jgi:ribosomal protein S18 acetylase RimI-like enzyme
MNPKKNIEIRHPRIEEMENVANIMLHSFEDKFSHIFRDNTKLGEKLFRMLFSSIPEAELSRFIIAVRGNEILGMEEIYTRTSIPSTLECLVIFYNLFRIFGLVKSIKKFVSIYLMLIEIVKKDNLFIAVIAVHPDARGQGIGTKLINAAEKLAIKQNLKYLSLEVIFRNLRARKLYQNLGFKIISNMKSSLLLYFLGFNGASHMRKKL